MLPLLPFQLEVLWAVRCIGGRAPGTLPLARTLAIRRGKPTPVSALAETLGALHRLGLVVTHREASGSTSWTLTPEGQSLVPRDSHPREPWRRQAREDLSRIVTLAETDPIVSACLHAYQCGAGGTWEHTLAEMVTHLATDRARLLGLATDALVGQAPSYPITDPTVSSEEGALPHGQSHLPLHRP